MCTTAIPTNNMENSFIIMTQVMPAHPASSGTGQNVPEPGAGFFNRLLSRTTGHDQDQSTPGPARKFLKREPKVLGTVQIMIGMVSFLFSVVIIQETYMLPFTQSLHGYWGSATYIFAGILSVVAGNTFRPQLIKGLLVLNAVSTVAAGTAVVLHSLDIAYTAYGLPNTLCYDNICSSFMTIGINGVLLVFSLLQFVVSICMFLFGLDATFCAEPMDVFVISNPNMDNLLMTQPPPYNEIEPQLQYIHVTS